MNERLTPVLNRAIDDWLQQELEGFERALKEDGWADPVRRAGVVRDFLAYLRGEGGRAPWETPKRKYRLPQRKPPRNRNPA